MSQITVRTSDGEIFTGESWESILRQFKAMNFSEPADLQELMANIAHRYEVISGDTFPTVGVGTYEDFGMELQKVGFLKILEGGRDA
tara:strand:+ start:1177 stop:1437 length:261 start_codon:yes stop_codon:yes gene_type:complete